MSEQTKTGKILLFADATCDIPPQYIKDNNIQIIGLRYQIGDTDGWYTGTDIDTKQLDEYYARMRKDESASTSLVLYDDAYTAFEPFFAEGYDIIHIGLSSGLAKTYENALNAGTDLAKKYGRKFYAPDTKLMSAPSYLVIRKIVQLLGEGVSFEKIKEQLPHFYKAIRCFFTVEDLKYLHKSGRLSSAAKVIGGILNVKPIITADSDGKLVSITKKMGRLASIQFLASQVASIDFDESEVVIIHADCLQDAKALEQKVHESFPDVKCEIINMGFIIGTHTGPGALGIGFKLAE